MPKSKTKLHSRGRLMYQLHPDRDTLFAGIPSNVVTATENVQAIRFDDLLEMRKIVCDLADFIVHWKPDLIPFFATGGIPYLIPAMHVLERAKQHGFLDGKHFHLFPGLSWGGVIKGNDSESFFAATFGEIIRKTFNAEDALRILVIDTTNSGNAVNKAVAACQKAITASGVLHSRLTLRVIGVVNTSHAEAQATAAAKSLVAGGGRKAYVLTPSGYSASSQLLDRQFTVFSPAVPGHGFPFELAYWLAGNIPTEDKAELIGVEAVHESLSTVAAPKAGRLKIVYGNGETQQGTGLGPLHGRLISLLSMSLDSVPWEKMQAIHNLPPLTDEYRESLAEIKELSEGGLRLFELQPMGLLSRRKAEPADVVDRLLNVRRLLTDVEVYLLGTLTPPPRRIAGKVRASLQKLRCTPDQAVKYFRRAFPGLLNNDPGGDASEAWWDSTVGDMPKEDFVDKEQVNCVSDRPVEEESCELAEEDCGDTEDGLALDFVVIAGGVEEARDLLADLRSRDLSLDTIAAYLNQTWPVDADKALQLAGPTNEQVAMNFVWECGGHADASACLESWIATYKRGDSRPSS